jgi:hypothetical protein
VRDPSRHDAVVGLPSGSPAAAYRESDRTAADRFLAIRRTAADVGQRRTPFPLLA